MGATFNVGTGKSVTFSGVIGGSGGTSGGGLTVNGAGTVDLLGANTYGTSTTVSAGELITGVAGALPSGDDLIVNNSAKVDLAGFAQTVASLSSTCFNQGDEQRHQQLGDAGDLVDHLSCVLRNQHIQLLRRHRRRPVTGKGRARYARLVCGQYLYRINDNQRRARSATGYCQRIA